MFLFIFISDASLAYSSLRGYCQATSKNMNNSISNLFCYTNVMTLHTMQIPDAEGGVDCQQDAFEGTHQVKSAARIPDPEGNLSPAEANYIAPAWLSPMTQNFLPAISPSPVAVMSIVVTTDDPDMSQKTDKVKGSSFLSRTSSFAVTNQLDAGDNEVIGKIR